MSCHKYIPNWGRCRYYKYPSSNQERGTSDKAEKSSWSSEVSKFVKNYQATQIADSFTNQEAEDHCHVPNLVTFTWFKTKCSAPLDQTRPWENHKQTFDIKEKALCKVKHSNTQILHQPHGKLTSTKHMCRFIRHKSRRTLTTWHHLWFKSNQDQAPITLDQVSSSKFTKARQVEDMTIRFKIKCLSPLIQN
jgi:hypothetical protein